MKYFFWIAVVVALAMAGWQVLAPGAVSYTHLDVYKRQAPDCPTMANIVPLETWNDRFSKSTSSASPERKTLLKPSTLSRGS